MHEKYSHVASSFIRWKQMRETRSGRRTRRPYGGANLYSLPVSYVAVDTETTGLDFDFCDIIEIGAVRVEDGEIADTLIRWSILGTR